MHTCTCIHMCAYCIFVCMHVLSTTLYLSTASYGVSGYSVSRYSAGGGGGGGFDDMENLLREVQNNTQHFNSNGEESVTHIQY